MIEFFESELLHRAQFHVHGFTKRTGGVSKSPYDSLNLSYDVGDDPKDVAENLKRLKSALNIDEPLVRVKQVHGNRIVGSNELTPSSWIDPPTVEADGIISADTQAVLAVQNADCAPVLLADPNKRIVAAIHAGWRGAANGVVRNGVRAMIDAGGDPSVIIAVIGPCICLGCYEVDEDVAHHFPESCDPVKGKPGKFQLDLGLAVEVSLIGAGLTSKNIERIDACPSCMEKELFSHRGSGGSTGRILGFIKADTA